MTRGLRLSNKHEKEKQIKTLGVMLFSLSVLELFNQLVLNRLKEPNTMLEVFYYVAVGKEIPIKSDYEWLLIILPFIVLSYLLASITEYVINIVELSENQDLAVVKEERGQLVKY